MLGGIRDADDNGDKTGFKPVSKVDNDIKMVIDGKIVKALIRAGVSNIENELLFGSWKDKLV